MTTCARTLALAACASPALAQSTPIQVSDAIFAPTTTHIYFNIATGETVATLTPRTGTHCPNANIGPAWVADNTTPCADFGQTSATMTIVDVPNGEFGFPTEEGHTLLDWGDIAPDTIIDMVQLSYGTSHNDTDSDSDSIADGLADFAYSVVFTQPGRRDVDNADGDDDSQTGIDGDPADANLTAIPLAAPRGTTVDNGDGTFSIVLDDGVNAIGADDGWDEFDSAGFFDATYWMGGFSCNDPNDGTINAFGQLKVLLNSPNSPFRDCTGTDFAEPYGTLDIFDVFAFLDLYIKQQPCADFAEPYGVFDLFDVFGFLAIHIEGCPL